jgi:glycosyltransferase involved in cell wall biosynthesis
MKAIKLVHITTVPQSLFFMTGQVGFMKERNFEIHGVSSPGEILSRFAKQEGVAVYPVEMPRRITPLRDLVAIAGILKVLRRVKPHIVHSHTPKGGVLGMVSAWLAGVPVRIYHMRGLPFTTASGWKRQVLIWSERIACRLAHRVFCVSSSIRQLAIDTRLCRPEKITILARGSGNGVDATGRFSDEHVSDLLREETMRRCKIPSEALVLGFIGRIVLNKGIVELTEAWARLREEFPHLHLLIVGPHEAQDPIPSAVDHALRSDPRVHLIGEDWNVVPLYAVMDVLALPTYREGFPNTLLEAAAMKVPVVATKVPGCTDAVQDGVTGFLVPPYDGRRLAAAIRDYLSDPELRCRHGAAAREWVLQEFRPQGIWEAVHHEYTRCLQRAGIDGLERDGLLVDGGRVEPSRQEAV